ncbi:LapA family protein [Desulfitobacterium sp.]|uniref:LapA family protein n=1 Tax=Desulfitobacterium sp. TaxID=49981 RepID=UPI002C15BE58|nr:LapA family protein [Desulfitobacterium sp.]HVJ49688.1 LapA family protein [Desulfitobacterium sp.]
MYLLILTLAFALLIAIFAIQNAAPVAINLFWITTQVPLVLVIIGSVLAGALIVFLIALWRQFRPKKKNKAISTIPVEEKDLDSKEKTPPEKSNPDQK